MDQWEAEGQFPAHKVFKLLGNAGFLGVNKPVGKEVFTARCSRPALERWRSRRGGGRHPAAAFPAVTAGPGDVCLGWNPRLSTSIVLKILSQVSGGLKCAA